MSLYGHVFHLLYDSLACYFLNRYMEVENSEANENGPKSGLREVEFFFKI